MTGKTLAQRKIEHLDICARGDVEALTGQGFADYHLIPQAWPVCSLSEIDTSCEFLGRKFSYPLMIPGMTGGIERGHEINRRLAKFAQAYDFPMGVGSQRLGLERPECAAIFQLKQDFPDLFLVGNLGFAQLLANDGLEACERAVAMVEADALAIHLNLLQECIQGEFAQILGGFEERLKSLCATLSCPVIVKEVGCGISPDLVIKLKSLGVAAVDIGGRGGTSWAQVEGLRGSEQQRRLGEVFRNWGIATAYNLAAVNDLQIPLIATGGIRNGLTVAKAVSLGASLVGLGLPFMQAALQSEEAVFEFGDFVCEGLRIAMLSSGCQNLGDLRSRGAWGEPFGV